MKFRQAVADTKLKLPRDVLDAAHKALSDELAHTPPGKAFAKAFVEIQIRGASRGPRAFPGARQRGHDERMKFFAQEMVPVLRGHLEQARSCGGRPGRLNAPRTIARSWSFLYRGQIGFDRLLLRA